MVRVCVVVSFVLAAVLLHVEAEHLQLGGSNDLSLSRRSSGADAEVADGGGSNMQETGRAFVYTTTMGSHEWIRSSLADPCGAGGVSSYYT